MASTSAVGGPSNTQNVQAPAKLTTEEANAAWKSVLDADLSQRQQMKTTASSMYLGDFRMDRYKGKVEADMQKYVAEHPNATADEIQAYAKDRVSKHAGYEVVQKMMDDYMMSRMMARAKELMADLWT